MNYATLVVLAIVVAVSLCFKYLAAKIMARENVSTAKAKLIADLFSFNPLDILAKFLENRK